MTEHPRYFLFHYTWTDGTTAMGDGHLHGVFYGFPSRYTLIAEAKNYIPVSAETVVIASWNEFRDEADYRAFIGEG